MFLDKTRRDEMKEADNLSFFSALSTFTLGELLKVVAAGTTGCEKDELQCKRQMKNVRYGLNVNIRSKGKEGRQNEAAW